MRIAGCRSIFRVRAGSTLIQRRVFRWATQTIRNHPRPPENRLPEKDEISTCSPFLLRQLSVIKPKAVVALGAVAAKNLLAINAPMSELRGRWYDFRPAGGDSSWPGTRLAVTYHPAFLLRDPRQKGEAWKDLQMVMKYLGLKPPAKIAQ